MTILLFIRKLAKGVHLLEYLENGSAPFTYRGKCLLFEFEMKIFLIRLLIFIVVIVLKGKEGEVAVPQSLGVHKDWLILLQYAHILLFTNNAAFTLHLYKIRFKKLCRELPQKRILSRVKQYILKKVKFIYYSFVFRHLGAQPTHLVSDIRHNKRGDHYQPL